MSPTRKPRETLALAAEAASVWLRHSLVEPLRARPGLPRAMDYLSTHRCNARCAMCGIWKESGSSGQDLSPEALGSILGDRLFSRMEFIGMSGGEPFVRQDLPAVCATVLERCAAVKRLSLTTNGLLTERVRTMLPEIANRARDAGVLLDVSVSVHGMGQVLDRIYGVDGAFGTIERTIGVLEGLRDDGWLSFSINCVLLADNLAVAEELRLWAADRRIPLSFVVGERRARFRTEGLESAFVGIDDRQPLIEFLRSLADDRSQPTASAGRYREVAAILEGRKTRSLSCHYAMGGLLLGHDGQLYYCSHSRSVGSCLDRSPQTLYFAEDNLEYRRRELVRSECLHCPPYTRTRWEIEKDLPRVLVDMIRHKLTVPRRRSDGSRDRS